MNGESEYSNYLIVEQYLDNTWTTILFYLFISLYIYNHVRTEFGSKMSGIIYYPIVLLVSYSFCFELFIVETSLLCLQFVVICLIAGPVSFVRRFSYKDIKRATDGFHRIIYNNSHGAAYRAKFQDGEVALVKEVKDFNQGKDLFYREVQFLGRLHHRHLLGLRGFSTGRKRFDAQLLYYFVPLIFHYF